MTSCPASQKKLAAPTAPTPGVSHLRLSDGCGCSPTLVLIDQHGAVGLVAQCLQRDVLTLRREPDDLG